MRGWQACVRAPQPLTELFGLNVVDIACGSEHSLALTGTYRAAWRAVAGRRRCTVTCTGRPALTSDHVTLQTKATCTRGGAARRSATALERTSRCRG